MALVALWVSSLVQKIFEWRLPQELEVGAAYSSMRRPRQLLIRVGVVAVLLLPNPVPFRMRSHVHADVGQQRREEAVNA